MKHSSRQSKRSFCLPDLDHRLSMYALAASAAGVGLLALARPAEGKIIYTKAHRTIAPNSTSVLDLNNDGTPDIILKDIFSVYDASAYARLWALPARKSNQIWGHATYRTDFASALVAGVLVGPKGQFLPGAGVMAATSSDGGRKRLASGSCSGPWARVANRYLGLKFLIAGNVHFGWARLNVSCPLNSTITGLLTGYAYETVPNRPIVTGEKKGTEDVDNASQQSRTVSVPAILEPATLGRLAQGAASVAAWRRKQ